jgi:hypothetical protein
VLAQKRVRLGHDPPVEETTDKTAPPVSGREKARLLGQLDRAARLLDAGPPTDAASAHSASASDLVNWAAEPTGKEVSFDSSFSFFLFVYFPKLFQIKFSKSKQNKINAHHKIN